jgi:hypothetical protein
MLGFGWDHKKRTCKVQRGKILNKITLSLDSTELLVLIPESLWKLLCIILSPFTGYNMGVKVTIIQGSMKHNLLSRNLKGKCSFTTKPASASMSAIKNYLNLATLHCSYKLSINIQQFHNFWINVHEILYWGSFTELYWFIPVLLKTV